MRSTVLALSVLLLALPGTAHAHFTLLAPPPASNSTNGGKGNPPCGPTDTLSNAITPVMGGSKLTIKVNETVFHPGFYRVALSIKARTELPLDNVVKDASGKVLPPAGPGTSATADYETTPVFPVLADNLFPHTTAVGMFTGEVTLPNVNCDKCTLQVIEFMAMHGSNGPQAGYFYHHCADLKITVDTSKPVFDPTAGSGAGGGSSAGAGNAAGASASGASGAPAGAAGASAVGSGGTGGSSGGGSGISGGGSSAALAGAPAAAGATASAAGASTAAAGAMGTASAGDGADSGSTFHREDQGCAVSTRAAGSTPLLSLLVGLLVLGRRRNRRR